MSKVFSDVEGPPLRGPALIIYLILNFLKLYIKLKTTLHNNRTVDIRKHIFFQCIFVHHGHNRIVFNTYN